VKSHVYRTKVRYSPLGEGFIVFQLSRHENAATDFLKSPDCGSRYTPSGTKYAHAMVAAAGKKYGDHL
jgi:hypothetical protein